MKCISAHSPRSFLSLILCFRCFIYLPQNEKGGIRRKLANAASSIYLIAIRKRRQEKSNKKAGPIPKMGKRGSERGRGKAGIGKGTTFSRAVCRRKSVALQRLRCAFFRITRISAPSRT